MPIVGENVMVFFFSGFYKVFFLDIVGIELGSGGLLCLVSQMCTDKEGRFGKYDSHKTHRADRSVSVDFHLKNGLSVASHSLSPSLTLSLSLSLSVILSLNRSFSLSLSHALSQSLILSLSLSL